ncbi:MAG: TIGR03564 family F420-dependent LLM class oxidoreductase [Thermoanaerobacterales bacterium]|nr:TIGR03564 family F420-dependent LLM class oxidoreductase [Thermoanaerobacterales bacterium]
MRISTTVGLQLHGPQTLDDVVDEVRHAATLGLHGAWWSQTFGWDALTAIAVTGRAVGDLAVLGTAVVPTYPRHVLALAGQALTTQAAVGGRLVLGVGPSHAPVVEGALGLAYDRPARHTREYLSALVPLLAGSPVDVRGELVRATGATPVPGAAPPPVLLAALGPVMLRIAGELADGTIVTWVTERSLDAHVVPRVTAAAEAAGRPRPQVVVSLPVALTDDPDAARAWVADRFGAANDLPSYRAVLDREGVAGVEDVVVAGPEGAVRRAVDRLAGAGATELVAVPVGPPDQVERTLALLGDIARTGRGTPVRPAPARPPA